MISKTKQAERREYWQGVIGEQQRSGKGIRAFCRERHVPEHCFYRWRVQLRKSAPTVRFALVERKGDGVAGGGIEIVLATGDRLRIAADAATLGLVLRVLRESR